MEADLASASLASADGDAPSGIYAMLNARFGSDWSSEIVEHTHERGSVTVLVQMTVNGISKMQFGSARANGDAGGALRRATAVALRGCAEMFGDDVEAKARTDRPAPSRPAVTRTGGAREQQVFTDRSSKPRECRKLDTGCARPD